MPALKKADQRELDALNTHVCRALTGSSRASNRGQAVRAYNEGNVEMLRLFSSLLESGVSFSQARHLYELLLSYAIEDAASYVTAERINAYHEALPLTVHIRNVNPTIPISGILVFCVMVDESDRKLAEQLVRDRWPGSLVEAQGLLNEMKLSSLPLAAGSL